MISQSSKDTILVSQYVAEMLFILGLLFAKLTGAMMTMSISQRNYYKVIQGFKVVCGLWALSSIFVVAFECGVPKPWNIFSNTCIRRVRTEHRPQRQQRAAASHATIGAVSSTQTAAIKTKRKLSKRMLTFETCAYRMCFGCTFPSSTLSATSRWWAL